MKIDQIEVFEVKVELMKRIQEVKEIIKIEAKPKQFWKGKLNGLQTALNLLNSRENSQLKSENL